ncbi:MAG: hypothetical protein ACXWMF_02690 [Syntrophales bacterium]
MSESEDPKIKKANIRLTDGSHVKGQMNIKDHDRLSDLLNFGEDLSCYSMPQFPVASMER